jgi:peptidoglycan/LPS O-acetylase OafA/YrhL
MCLVTAPQSTLVHALSWRPLAYLGLISYGLYLYHVLILNAVSSHTTLPRHESAPVAIALAVLAASFSYHFIERPFLRLKLRLEPVVQGRPVQASVTAAD